MYKPLPKIKLTLKNLVYFKLAGFAQFSKQTQQLSKYKAILWNINSLIYEGWKYISIYSIKSWISFMGWKKIWESERQTLKIRFVLQWTGVLEFIPKPDRFVIWNWFRSTPFLKLLSYVPMSSRWTGSLRFGRGSISV